MVLFNKFSQLTKKLLEKSLWVSDFTLIKRQVVKNGLEISFEETSEEISLHGIIATVDKSLIDNINILPTDTSFFVSALECTPEINDLIKYNNQTYRILRIVPTGSLNNIPVCYNVIGRLA